MTEATKVKLSRWVKDPFVRDMLESFGILYPHQIKAASNDELVRAGLKLEEIAEVRASLPVAMSAESPEE